MVEEREKQQFRLHVSGLAADVVSKDLERRFGAFGTVVKVDGIGKLDANGCPLRYGFVDIISTEALIKRCMNLLSGTTYKGSTLRIAPARPDYLVRAEREKANLPINSFVDPDEEALRARQEKAALKLERKLKRIRARRRGIEGFESSNMDIMTIQKFKSRKGVNGWKKDPDTSLPIFPIITRPLRPLSGLMETTRTQDEANPQEPSIKLNKVPNRARRIRIDPTLYRAAVKNRKTHILGPRAISIELFKLGFSGGTKDAKQSQRNPQMWECQNGDDEVIWKLKNGDDLVQEERVPLSGYTLKLRDPNNQDSLFQSCSSSPSSLSDTGLTSDTLRLRGGGTSSKPSRQSKKKHQSCDQTSQDHAMENEVGGETGQASAKSKRNGTDSSKTSEKDIGCNVQLGVLTDLFKAKEEEKIGFRLTDALEGIELDEDVVVTNDDVNMDELPTQAVFEAQKLQEDKEVRRSAVFVHPSRLTTSGISLQSTNLRSTEGKSKGPFFFYPTDDDPDSQLINRLVSPEHRERARQHWLSHNLSSCYPHSWRTFVRTESTSEIEAEHDKKKTELTEHMRRRHKDAIKRQQKWGHKQTTKLSTSKDSEAESDHSN